MSKSIAEIINDRLNGKTYTRDIKLSREKLGDERGFRIQLEAKQEAAVDQEVRAIFDRPVNYSTPTLIKSASKQSPEKIFNAKLGVASVQSVLAKVKSVESKMSELKAKKGFSRTPVSIAKMAG